MFLSFSRLIVSNLNRRCDEFIIQIRSTPKKEPVLRCPTKVFIHGLRSQIEAEIVVVVKGFWRRHNKNWQTISLLRMERLLRLFRQWSLLWRSAKKCRSLTSIMRITVEFRFVEHCSWLLNPQLSKIVLFFGQTSEFGQKSHKIGWIQIGSLSIVRALRRVSTKLLF